MSGLKAMVRRVARFLLWPVRRYFDPRFTGLGLALQENIRLTLESTELLGRSLAELSSSLAEANSRLINVHDLVEATHTEAQKASGVYFDRVRAGAPRDLDDKTAALLNFESGSRGLAAQSGLWFNPPVSIEYRPGEVALGTVNERAAEVPYVFRGVAGLAPGARILDVGATESLVAFSLASLGYDVTALDPRPYGLEHPNLRTVVGTIEDWDAEGGYDAIVCLSTVEHIGLGAYGVEATGDGADAAAVRKMRELTAPGGRLLLTTRFGRAAVGEVERTYDRAGLEALLDGWEVQDLSFARRTGKSTWELAEPGGEPEPDAELVALVTATRPG
jgi:SAM-dependent methyltransferase